MKHYFVLVVILGFIFTFGVFAQQLEIHHIDVGQADATLIKSPTGVTMLIDGGNTGNGTNIIRPYLTSLGITSLNYVVCSHYHADHLGGLDEVINGMGASNIGSVYDRGSDAPLPTTVAFNDYVTAANSTGRRYKVAIGQIIDLGGGVTMQCVATDGEVINYGVIPGATGSENDLSIGWKLNFNSFQYFTGGDLGGESTYYGDSETPLAPQVGNVDAMKINHHASQYSTNQIFVNTLQPEVSFIEVGNGNTYGHPTQAVLNRLATANSYIYQTETGAGGTIPSGKGVVANGNIILKTSGTSYTVTYGTTTNTYPGDGGAPDITPPVISAVTASSITSSSATITWTTDEASNSVVDYGLTTAYGFTVTNSTMVTSHSVSLSGLSASTLYHYRVKSTDAANNTATSTDYTFTTLAGDVTPPVISNILATNITLTGATITWSTDEASSSDVDYGLTTAYGSTTSGTNGVISHSVPLTGLTSGTLYHYRVKSTDGAGNTATSADNTFTTSSAPVSTLIESFADGNFTANPVWGGSTTKWQVTTSSDVAAGATNSYTLRLNQTSATAGTQYLRTQRTASWGTSQSWSFWIGRRAQAATNANQSIVWLWANGTNLTASTIDGYRIRFGDDAGDDNIVLQSVTNNVATDIITSSGTVPNGLTDIGFMVRVTRTTGSVWTIYTSTLPTATGGGAIATAIPSAANTAVSQGSVTNSTYTTFTNGYFGFMAVHSSGASARTGAEFDQLYFDISSSSPLGKPVISPEIVSVPADFQLYQNFPNPFNPSTVIKFQIPDASVVTLKVYDLLGREVSSLVNEQLETGNHEVVWNADKYPSGIYIYRMSGRNFTETRKMLLVK